MAIIKKPDHSVGSSTSARVVSGMVSAAFLAGSVSFLPAAIRALIASGGLMAHLSKQGWAALGGSIAYLLLAALSARRAWKGRWPAGEDVDDANAPIDWSALSDERIGISPAELAHRAAEIDDDDADDKEPDGSSS